MIYSINSNLVPAQSHFEIQDNSQSTEESGRDLAGFMHNIYLPWKKKLVVRWPIQKLADRATLNTLIKGQPNLSSLDINYLDDDTNTYITKNFMLGTPINGIRLEGTDTHYEQIEYHFVEN
jgi:hypothetical protein